MLTKPTTTNERTSEGNDVQQSIPSDPSMSETKDSEEKVFPQISLLVPRVTA